MKTLIRYRMFAILPALMLLAVTLERGVKAAPPSEAGITGTIKLDGTAPHQKPIDMSKEPYCQNLHKANPVTMETVVVGSDGGLKNVVVYISEGLSGAAANEVAPQTPTWDQKGCQYIPHVMGLDVNQLANMMQTPSAERGHFQAPKRNVDRAKEKRKRKDARKARKKARKSR